MKEKRKQFDASLAKVGDVVETRNGFKVRITCLDKLGDNMPVVGLIKIGKYREIAETFSKNGKFNCNNKYNPYDLFFPLKEYTGYINIYRNMDTVAKIKDFESDHHVETIIYNDENKAIEYGKLYKDYITTIKITYKA